MSRKKLFVYLVAPVLVSLVLMGLYFSGHVVLQRIVAPKLPPLPPDAWREFGLLENLQNLILLGLFGVACAGVARKRLRFEQAAWAVIAAGTLFVFCEELDYGTHHRAYLAREGGFQWFQPMTEWPGELIAQIDLEAEPVNLHNKPGVDKLFKKASDLLTGLFFGLFPLAALRMKNAWVRYAAPDKYVVLTVLAMFLLRSVTHLLGDLEKASVGDMRGLLALADTASITMTREPGAISQNLSEFRELNFYYILLVYCAELVFLRRTPEPAAETAQNGAEMQRENA